MRDAKGRFVKGHNTPHSAKTKLKISNTCKETGVGKWMTGRTTSEETKKKLSQNNSRYWLGKKRGEQSPETRAKISKALKGHYVSPETRERVSNMHKGKFGNEHPKWVDEKKHPFHKSIRETYKYRQWRTDVFERDNYSCVLCNKRGCFLEVDHYPKQFITIIKGNDIQTIDQSIDCIELWNTDNGRTLCRPCHLKTPTWGKR